ncbi:TonB-dependent receptor [Chromobacterium piscinae]|uniref:TonB-dependent receptor n=1 Tax=Chromobacterium piscinae TaxID=686831 RepID=A0ABV0H4W0_9NEIS|nr:TonB-dependent receptor [Chromobacterium piscinae]MBX9299215.1 TonB-dependent receptor [Chromobacterium vaccinii]MBX9346910.1 TonB-dependent receptor [Chromobacterium vaccinii]MBX9358393.1 TonB-dependent receptor [Chromobacterium vaccinii]MCD5327786.1 TonB-dependent receptor [Chromobacterium piscinae]NHQ81102.1 TonB-dependent receptor [Chromobacterium vaccinii]
MRVKTLAQAIAAIGLLGSGFAHAAEDSQLERVTITGSNIKRIASQGALPVEVLKKEDIAKTGASTVVQLLETLTAVNGVTSGTDSNSFVPGAAHAGLRGMNDKYTLVLLNGRRLATYAQLESGTDAFTDLNTLPLSVIESVEILRDGASAIYGSDAVAGVINFKTKRNYQGVDTYARYGQTQAGDGKEQAAGVSAGVGDLDKDGYNLMVSFDAYHREPVFYSKHEAIKTRDFRRFGGADNRYLSTWGGWSTDPSSKPYYAMPYCQKSLVTKGNGSTICPIDYDQEDAQVSPRTSRYGLLTTLTRKLDADSQFYMELGFNQSNTALRGGNNFLNGVKLNPGDAAYPTDPKLISALQAQQPFTPGKDSITVYRGLNEGWGRDVDSTSNTYHAVFGYSTYYKDWDYDASVNFSGNNITNKNQSYLTSLTDSLQTGNPSGPTYNPFIHGNPASSLTPYQVLTTDTASTSLQALELKASKSELFQLPGGAAGFAAGIQWWRETLESIPSDYSQQGLVLNAGPQSYLNASHSIFAAYSELNLPVVKNLEVQLALRADHYNDFGNTINPKIAFTYRPLKEVMFRGSATSGFKAPSFSQLRLNRTAYDSVTDQALCDQQHVSNCTPTSTQIRSGGNPNLQPETNDSFSLGMVLQPIKDLYASVDFYRINQKNVINALDTDDVVNNPSKYPGAIVRKPAPAGQLGEIDYINTPYQNAGGLTTSGLDFDLSYSWSLGSFGKVKLENQHSRLLSYKDHKLASDPWLEEVDYAIQPRWKNVFTAEYSINKFSAGVTARSYAGYKDLTQASSSPRLLKGKPARIPSYTAFDVDFSVSPLKKLTVGGGIKNIGNRIPPYFINGQTPGTFSGSSTDLWGRTYYVNVNYKF